MSEDRLSKVNEWLQLVAALAVVVGLVLVFQELRQTNQIARAERLADAHGAWVGSMQAKIEYDILSLMRKAVEEPKSLADTEIGHLDGFFELLWTSSANSLAVNRLGLGDFDVESNVNDIAWHLQSRIGRAWFEQNVDWMQPTAPELYSAVQEKLKETPIPTRFQYLIDLRSALEEPDQGNDDVQSN